MNPGSQAFAAAFDDTPASRSSPAFAGQALDHPVLQCTKRAFDASLRLRAVGTDDVDVQRQQGATELGYPVAAGSLLAVHPLNDVLHRSSSHRCPPRRSAPSPSPTLPHRISRSRGVKSRPTCPSVRVDKLGERFAHAWGAFHTDKAALELEIGFGDPEHLAASLFRLLGNVRDLSGRYDLSARLLPK